MAPLPRLLVFCDFLEILLHTTSLALLRRMFTDFYTGNEHTLQDFMRLGATVISVLPMQRKGPQQLKEAARLLAEQKKDTVHATSTEMDPNRQNQTQMYTTTSQSCVFRYLSARVASRNILWLRDMFHEFCRGENALLREFLRRGDQAISVIPVDIQALCMAPLPPPPLSVDQTFSVAMAETGVLSTPTPSEVTPSATLSPQRKRSRGQEQEPQSAGDNRNASESRARKQARRASVPSQEKEAVAAATFELDPMPQSEAEMRASIMAALGRLEAKEPWKEAFNPEKLSLPFSRVRYPQLAAVLQAFWQKNARAVWERKFWSPLSRSRNLELHNQRRCRQLKAMTFFEKKVITPVYSELGASFFVRMDQRVKPHSGWYFFEQTVDLFTVAHRYGLPACLQYMESEAFKRFPMVPGQNRNIYGRVNGKSRSMWSSSESLRPILDEIVSFKAKTKDSSNSVEL
ncbi:hypothetical protein PC128_g24741 [Phytophthora cactorum]|nr:hypothetical protein PC128_g24741 [Phytophthora cactorum]